MRSFEGDGAMAIFGQAFNCGVPHASQQGGLLSIDKRIRGICLLFVENDICEAI